MKRLFKLFAIFWILFTFLLLNFTLSFAEEESKEKWRGFDEAVLEEIAKAHGKEPKGSFISLEGDLELFMFSLMAGISGFVVGYYYRKIFVEGSYALSNRKESQTSA